MSVHPRLFHVCYTCSLNIVLVQLLSIFIVQKAAAPKNGVEFRQGSIVVIRSGLATLWGVATLRDVKAVV